MIGSALNSCITPVNLNFDSARTLEKGASEVLGAASVYTISPDGANNSAILNTNLALRYGYGITKRYDLKLRAELLYSNFADELINDDSFNPYFTSLFFQVENKIGLNDHVAISLPVGAYVIQGGGAFAQLDPGAYFTFFNSDHFELTVVPKCHIWIGGGAALQPAISMNAGFSSDLNQWAIRPAVGYDGYLSFGAGFSYFFNNRRSEQTKEND